MSSFTINSSFLMIDAFSNSKCLSLKNVEKLLHLPFGYDNLASLAFPPSPQLSASPGRHLSPVPMTLT